ncbi:MAG: hypothetical protein HC933_00410 [Pleurocapsa sp. SU_196_0]|nr:hypothetical protein [Pleurocapsa sp. SU_196_0]
MIVLLVSLACPLSRAAPNTPDPVLLIDASGIEVMLYAPVMRDREQARALRRAVVERGVRVTILSEPESAREAASYLPSLKLAGQACSWRGCLEGNEACSSWMGGSPFPALGWVACRCPTKRACDSRRPITSPP